MERAKMLEQGMKIIQGDNAALRQNIERSGAPSAQPGRHVQTYQDLQLIRRVWTSVPRTADPDLHRSARVDQADTSEVRPEKLPAFLW
jgi:hypothetical protein